MSDTVLVTSPDPNLGVLSPTLSDAIAAVQFYALQVQSSLNLILAAQITTLAAETAALNAAAAAEAAATAAASGAATLILSQVEQGTATVGTASKIKSILVSRGSYQTVTDYVMNNFNITDRESLEWNNGQFYALGGVMSGVIKTATGYNDSQMAGVWSDAAGLTN